MQRKQGSTVLKVTALIGIVIFVLVAAVLFYSCRQEGGPAGLEEANGVEATLFVPIQTALHA